MRPCLSFALFAGVLGVAGCSPRAPEPETESPESFFSSQERAEFERLMEEEPKGKELSDEEFERLPEDPLKPETGTEARSAPGSRAP